MQIFGTGGDNQTFYESIILRTIFMAGKNPEKKRKKRKVRQKKRKNKAAYGIRKEKASFYFENACWCMDNGNYSKAETLLKQAIRREPDDPEMYMEMARIGEKTARPDLVVFSLGEIRKRGLVGDTPNDNKLYLFLCIALLDNRQYMEASMLAGETLRMLDNNEIRVINPRKYKSDLISIITECRRNFKLPVSAETKQAGKDPKKGVTHPPVRENGFTRVSLPGASPDKSENKGRQAPPPAPGGSFTQQIPISMHMEAKRFEDAFKSAHAAKKDEYDLVMEAIGIRFEETFDHLLCLGDIRGVSSFIYQEETARKILKTFRGRAMLSDEVGMGKTIEACMVLREYIMRQMVKSVLILTPTPLVSQWREELKSKFRLDFLSTDDAVFKAEGTQFWQHSQIVASINVAKSKRNFSTVTAREYDIVIVDEAHHLKNKSTLNWKLVNSLKKRFLLLLTATPVENNLMELYNLITLLKPGQLKTASAFKDEFMERGDPTNPRNRERLKGLLGQVMIRNTRAVSNIRIPPRFAETIRITPTAPETELYERVSELARDINRTNGTGKRMILKHLLAEAGSSPAAVEKTLTKLLGNREFMIHQENEIRAIRNLTRSMGDTGKNKMVLKLISGSGDKIIIFVKYRATLDHLSDVLDWHGVSCSLFHGQMNNAQKDEAVDLFKNKTNVLVSTGIGGEGRNLQFCHRMINYDLPWNPMRIEQRIGRIHRIGQEKEVMIYNLCSAGSIEDYILEILDRKINMFEMVIGEIDMIVGRLRGEQDFSDMVYDIWVNSDSRQKRRESFDKLGSRLKRGKTGYEKTKDLDGKLFGENYEL